MSIIVVTIASILTALIIYFLVNAFNPLTNQINKALKVNNRSHAIVYTLVCTLCFIPLYYYAEYERKHGIAVANGYSDYDTYRGELAKAESFGLPLQAFQREMAKANKLGLHTYQDYINLLEAQDYGYDDYATFQEDVNLAQQYGLPLYIYREEKEEALSKNFSNFDEYLIAREEELLVGKMASVDNLKGDYNIDSVPLGVNKSEFLSTVYNCKISQIPDYAFPVTKSMAPRNEAMVNHFFPATSRNSHFGLNIYSMNFKTMPGLDRKTISKYEMKCEDGRYDLWFLNSDDSLVLYEKTINLPNIRQHDEIVSRVTQTLNEKCDSDINIGLETSFEESGTRKIKNLYCKNFQDYIIATIVDGPIISGVRQEADVHIGYLSERQWNKYISELRSSKGKKNEVQFTQSDNKNKTKTFESRI